MTIRVAAAINDNPMRMIHSSDGALLSYIPIIYHSNLVRQFLRENCNERQAYSGCVLLSHVGQPGAGTSFILDVRSRQDSHAEWHCQAIGMDQSTCLALRHGRRERKDDRISARNAGN